MNCPLCGSIMSFCTINIYLIYYQHSCECLLQPNSNVGFIINYSKDKTWKSCSVPIKCGSSIISFFSATNYIGTGTPITRMMINSSVLYQDMVNFMMCETKEDYEKIEKFVNKIYNLRAFQ